MGMDAFKDEFDEINNVLYLKDLEDLEDRVILLINSTKEKIDAGLDTKFEQWKQDYRLREFVKMHDRIINRKEECLLYYIHQDYYGL